MSTVRPYSSDDLSQVLLLWDSVGDSWPGTDASMRLLLDSGAVSVVAEDVWDLTALHRARARGELKESLAAHAEPRAPARRLWHASGGSAG